MKIVYWIASAKKGMCQPIYWDRYLLNYVYVFQNYFYMGINTTTRQHNIIPKVFRKS